MCIYRYDDNDWGADVPESHVFKSDQRPKAHLGSPPVRILHDLSKPATPTPTPTDTPGPTEPTEENEGSDPATGGNITVAGAVDEINTETKSDNENDDLVTNESGEGETQTEPGTQRVEANPLVTHTEEGLEEKEKKEKETEIPWEGVSDLFDVHESVTALYNETLNSYPGEVTKVDRDVTYAVLFKEFTYTSGDGDRVFHPFQFHIIEKSKMFKDQSNHDEEFRVGENIRALSPRMRSRGEKLQAVVQAVNKDTPMYSILFEDGERTVTHSQRIMKPDRTQAVIRAMSLIRAYRVILLYIYIVLVYIYIFTYCDRNPQSEGDRGDRGHS